MLGGCLARARARGAALVHSRGVRQHVNPLSYSEPMQPPQKWAEVFDNAQRPLLLDIGCARGEWVRELAASRPDMNFLGMEIRSSVAPDARTHAECGNLHFMPENAVVGLDPVLRSLPDGAVQWVTLMHPDPWFKKRHWKRRVLCPPFIELLRAHLRPGAVLYAQTDVQELHDFHCHMMDAAVDAGAFAPVSELPHWRQPAVSVPLGGAISENPFGVATGRETFTRQAHGHIWAAAWRRT